MQTANLVPERENLESPKRQKSKWSMKRPKEKTWQLWLPNRLHTLADRIFKRSTLTFLRGRMSLQRRKSKMEGQGASKGRSLL